MFIKTLKIKNLKCFDDKSVLLSFSIPDGKNLGSGLNIFVGENNSGKSTVFEAIDFIRNKTRKNLDDIKNKKASQDSELSIEIIFSGKVNDVIGNFAQENKKEIFKEYVYISNDEECFRLLRTSKKIEEIWLWNNNESKFENKTGLSAPIQKLFETNFVWSDTNPNDQASFGSTTICGNLLKEIARRFENDIEYQGFAEKFHETFNKEGCGLKKELGKIEKRTQEIFSEQFSDAKISFHFDELKIDSFFKNTKVEVNDDGIPTYMEEKGSGMQRSVALALLQVYVEELIKHPDNPDATKPFFLFIDEPEICLHPQAQFRLFGAILKLSKTKQVFIATHSPYFFKNSSIKNSGLFIFKKSPERVAEIVDLKSKSWGLFPWSPSWGEINYFAYNLQTIEFHNELYGFLESERRDELDALLKNMDWFNEKNNKMEKVSLQKYIRNSMHHPENNKNTKFTDQELKNSIEEMIKIIKPKLFLQA